MDFVVARCVSYRMILYGSTIVAAQSPVAIQASPTGGGTTIVLQPRRFTMCSDAGFAPIDYSNANYPTDDNTRCVQCNKPGADESAFCSPKCQDACLALYETVLRYDVARMEADLLAPSRLSVIQAECERNEAVGAFCIHCDL